MGPVRPATAAFAKERGRRVRLPGGAEPLELRQGGSRLADGDLRLRLVEHLGELEPGARGVQRQVLGRKRGDGRTEKVSRGRVVDGCGDPAEAEARHRVDPRQRGVARDQLETTGRGVRARSVSLNQLHVDQQGQERSGQDVVTANRVQAAVQDRGRHRRLAVREVQQGERVRRLWQLLEAGEELGRFLQTSLSHAELGELGGGMNAPSLHVGRLHRAKPLGQQTVSHLPLPRGDEHLGAACVAEPEHGDVVVRRHPRLDRGAPLLDALPVRRQLAGRDPDADDVPDRFQTPNLAAERGGERLVDLGHARLDRAGCDVGVAVPDQGRGLQIGVVEAPGHVERLCGVAIHLSRRGATLGSGQGEPALFGHVAGVTEQALGAGQPSSAHRGVAVRRAELPGEPERARGRLPHVGSLAEPGVRALHLRDRAVRIMQPPQRQTESLVRVCRRRELDRLLEGVSRSRPVAGCKCLQSGLEVVGPCADGHPVDGVRPGR